MSDSGPNWAEFCFFPNLNDIPRLSATLSKFFDFKNFQCKKLLWNILTTNRQTPCVECFLWGQFFQKHSNLISVKAYNSRGAFDEFCQSLVLNGVVYVEIQAVTGSGGCHYTLTTRINTFYTVRPPLSDLCLTRQREIPKENMSISLHALGYHYTRLTTRRTRTLTYT